jgi:hypothetical protein
MYLMTHRLTTYLNWHIFSAINKGKMDANENALNKNARKHDFLLGVVCIVH